MTAATSRVWSGKDRRQGRTEESDSTTIRVDRATHEELKRLAQQRDSIVAADRILEADPSVVQVVPLTRMLRGYESEVAIELDDTTSPHCAA